MDIDSHISLTKQAGKIRGSTKMSMQCQTNQRVFLSWIAGMALSMKLHAKQPGAPAFKERG